MSVSKSLIVRRLCQQVLIGNVAVGGDGSMMDVGCLLANKSSPSGSLQERNNL